MSESYVKPAEAGLASEARAVGRRIARMLDALGEVNKWVAKGTISDESFDFKASVIEKLCEAGWRVTCPKNSYRVLPPLTGEALRRDVARAAKQDCILCGQPIGDARYRRRSDDRVRHMDACPPQVVRS